MHMSGRLHGLALALVVLFCPAPALADKRVALVFGNSAYRNISPLENPRHDAELMTATLRQDGFTLIGEGAQLDLDKAGLEAAVQKFGAALVGADVGLFYYAGHGVQVRGANYLVPIQANPAREADVDFQMVDMNVVLRQMEAAGTKLNLVVLDACRNNPFGGRGLRAAEGGLAQMRAPEGTLISFATQPGNVALDGDGNSPYTKALAASLRKPGLDIFQTFNDVGLAVKRATGGSQQPWVSSSPIDGRFFFVAPIEAAAPDQAAQAWAAVRDTTSVAVLDTYLEQFGGSVYAPFVRARREEVMRAGGEKSAASVAQSSGNSTAKGRVAAATPGPSPSPASPARRIARQDVENLLAPFDEALRTVQANYVDRREEQYLYGAAAAAIRRAFSPPQHVAAKPADAAWSATRADRDQFYAVAMDILNARATPAEDGRIVEIAIRGLVAALDSRASFFDQNTYGVVREQVEGASFGGVGLQLLLKDGVLRVVATADGGPAARAGIVVNDVIVAVDGVAVRGLSLPDIAAKTRGAPGSKLHLRIMREASKTPLEIDMVREVILPSVVRSNLDGGDIGYVKILNLNPRTREAVRQGFAELVRAGGRDNLKGFVLDLRNLTGGQLEQVVAVADDLLTKGDIVSTRGRVASSDRRYSAKEKPEDIAANKPLMVLINGGSTSGSEVLAGALHDNARATLIGTRSSGSGTNQTLYPLSGDRGAIRITTLRYLTPTGRVIEDAGIEPDIEVLQDEPAGSKGREASEPAPSRRLSGDAPGQGGSQSYVPAAAKDDKALQRAFSELRRTK
jgi:C-terminal peptidase prc